MGNLTADGSSAPEVIFDPNDTTDGVLLRGAGDYLTVVFTETAAGLTAWTFNKNGAHTTRHDIKIGTSTITNPMLHVLGDAPLVKLEDTGTGGAVFTATDDGGNLTVARDGTDLFRFEGTRVVTVKNLVLEGDNPPKITFDDTGTGTDFHIESTGLGLKILAGISDIIRFTANDVTAYEDVILSGDGPPKLKFDHTGTGSDYTVENDGTSLKISKDTTEVFTANDAKVSSSVPVAAEFNSAVSWKRFSGSLSTNGPSQIDVALGTSQRVLGAMVLLSDDGGTTHSSIPMDGSSGSMGLGTYFYVQRSGGGDTVRIVYGSAFSSGDTYSVLAWFMPT